MTKNILALDRSARRVDVDGRLHLDISRISKATVNPYYGREIPGAESLGLNLDQVYRLLRDPVELEKAAATFNNLPILSEHIPVSADDPKNELIIGSIGSDVRFESPYLVASLCFWDATAISGIETDKIKELSCAYRYVPVMEPGEYEGQQYDGRMTQIQGNHLALVEVGRAGSDVVVADHNPFVKENHTMKKTKLGNALLVTLGLVSPKLAQDSALSALVGSATRAKLNKKAVVEKLLAMDSDLDPQQLDNIIDAVIGVEEPEQPAMVGDKPDTPAAPVAPAASTSPAGSKADQITALLSGKIDPELLTSVIALLGTDEDPDDADAPEGLMKKEDVEQAMDSLREEMRALAEAEKDVRSVVGEVRNLSNAEQVYRFALDHMSVKSADVKDLAGLKALFTLARDRQATPVRTPAMAQDTAGATRKQFPGLSRIKQA